MLATARPDDLDAKLLAATGCSVAEVQTWLHGSPDGFYVARALYPFLTGNDAPSLADLAVMIVHAGPAEIAAEVADLYVKAPATPPLAPTPYQVGGL